MFTHELKKLPKNTYKIDIKIPWADVLKEYDKAFDVLHKDLTVEGFRKGKAPKTIAEKNIVKEDVYQQLMRALLPSVYDEIVNKENLRPVISPKVDLKSAKENEDWELTITLAEKPAIDLKNYKEVAKNAKEGVKKADIWVPGKDKAEKPNPDEDKQQILNEVLSAVIKEVKVEISDLILEEELSNRLSKLVDDIQKLGLSVDSYMKSKGITMDQLKEQYKKEIEDTYKVEFILMEIAEKENITIEEKDLEALFGHITDEKERQAAQQNAYFYASILRKQKVIDFLTNL